MYLIWGKCCLIIGWDDNINRPYFTKIKKMQIFPHSFRCSFSVFYLSISNCYSLSGATTTPWVKCYTGDKCERLFLALIPHMTEMLPQTWNKRTAFPHQLCKTFWALWQMFRCRDFRHFKFSGTYATNLTFSLHYPIAFYIFGWK